MEILTTEAKETINKLPMILRTAANMLVDSLQNIMFGKCSEQEVANIVCTADANSRGRYCDDELMTYDKAQKALGIKDRRQLKATMDKYGIRQVEMSNHKVGFPRDAVMALKTRLKMEECYD